MKPKFNVGDKVRIPQATAGHDRHKPETVFTILKVYTKGSVSYLLEDSASIWPETRLKKV